MGPRELPELSGSSSEGFLTFFFQQDAPRGCTLHDLTLFFPIEDRPGRIDSSSETGILKKISCISLPEREDDGNQKMKLTSRDGLLPCGWSTADLKTVELTSPARGPN